MLCDFGTTRRAGDIRTQWQTAKEPAATIGYAAPEVLNNAPHSTQSDVFSFAWVALGKSVTLPTTSGWSLTAISEILTGKHPYYWANSPHAVYGLVWNSVLPTSEKYQTISKENEVWPLLWACLKQDPDARPGILEVKGRVSVLYDPLTLCTDAMSEARST